MSEKRYTGVWPVAPTPFNDDGSLDLDGMKRVLDCIIDQGADGICILANFSEQFLLADDEREQLTRLSLEHVSGRVPVIVTISHYSTDVVLSRAQRAKAQGASMAMMMAPYHGALMKGSANQTFEHFQRVGEAGLPIMLQDAPLSGVDLPVDLLIRMADEIEMLKLFKIECPRAADKIRMMSSAASNSAGNSIEAIFDGEEGINLLADLDAGIDGAMTSATIPDLINPVIASYVSGDRSKAVEGYSRILPVVNHENRQCGFQASKVAMVEGGVIKSDHCRHPIGPLHPATQSLLLELLRSLDPVVLRWGK